MSSGIKPSITPTPDGPYVVKDLETLRNRKGPIGTKPTMALCRCGGSANKLFLRWHPREDWLLLGEA